MAALDYKYTSLPRQWPGKQRPPGFTRKRSPFKIIWTNTEKMLAKEIEHLGGKDVTIAVDIRNPGFFRADGMLRADARPMSPAVIISFTTREGVRLTFPCDTFAFWQDNVHAITLSLESLRRVDRYGVTQGDQQYVGFKALAAGGPRKMTVEEAAEVVAEFCPFPANLIASEPSVAIEGVKMARRKAHPDSGGSEDAFKRVQEASEIVEGFHTPTADAAPRP
jgi:hypothetical protein